MQYSSTRHSRGKTPTSAAHKAYKQRSRCNHPKVHAPAVRHVVKDRACASLVEDPSQEGDRPFSVQFTAVRELDVAVWISRESYGSIRSSIRASQVLDASRDSRGIAV